MEVTLRILCDFVPESGLDGLHLMGQTTDNEESVLSRGVAAVKAGLCSGLTVMEDPVQDCAYAGGKRWTRTLRSRLRNNPAFISQLPFPRRGGVEMTHTYGEALALVAKAKKEGWRSVGVVAQPLHQVRAFVSAVSAALQESPDLKVYSLVGHSLAWNEVATHSQGTTTGVRASLVQGEIDRLKIFEEKGDLVSLNEVLCYLNRRDGIN